LFQTSFLVYRYALSPDDSRVAVALGTHAGGAARAGIDEVGDMPEGVLDLLRR
jgi:hypothetical protein